MRLFYDIESDNVVTEEELKENYLDLVKQGELEDGCFGAYIKDCTKGNGCIELINERTPLYHKAMNQLFDNYANAWRVYDKYPTPGNLETVRKCAKILDRFN